MSRVHGGNSSRFGKFLAKLEPLMEDIRQIGCATLHA